MASPRETTTERTLSGRLIVVFIVVMGAGLGLAGMLLRERRGLSLPLKPGAIVVVTCETTRRPVEEGRRGDAADGPDDPRWTRFSLAVAPSTELAANLGALMTGKMPRASGLVRGGDALRAEVPTLAEMAREQGFATAAFVARAADELKAAGVTRGFASVAAQGDAADAELATKAADWLAARGTAPSFAWLHAKGDAAVDGFLARLHERGVDEHAVVVSAGPLAPAPGGRIRLALRLPVALLPLRVDPQPVSLVDVVASVTEAFGVRAPDGIGTPWLLHPDARMPNFVLSTRPLAGAFAACDEVWLRTVQVEYVDAPVSGRVDPETGLSSELRGIVEARFRYRFEEAGLAALTRGADDGGGPRVRIARSTLPPPTK